MPDIICGRCGTTLALPNRRNSDMPILRRGCPTCTQPFDMHDIEPMAYGKPGVVQILQKQLSDEAAEKPAVLRKGPTKTKDQWGPIGAPVTVRIKRKTPVTIDSETGQQRTPWQPEPIQTFG